MILRSGGISRLGFDCSCKYVCERETEKERRKEKGEIGRIISLFSELMEMAAHKSPRLGRNSHLGKHLLAFACVCLCLRDREQNHCA